MMTASQLVTLKASVDKEMKRRCYNGSMTAYAGSSYAFQIAPAEGGIIQAQQGNAVIQPLCTAGCVCTGQVLRYLAIRFWRAQRQMAGGKHPRQGLRYERVLYQLRSKRWKYICG